MKTEKNILIAFILNFTFSIVEFIGGIFTGSIAIISDAVHDLGDAASIGASFFLEKKSKRPPDEKYTYGYARYSVFGGAITTIILLLGSVAVIYSAISRIFHPSVIHYNGMLIFAVVGVCVNLAAAFFTREGDSLNQKAVNLHMLEDVCGWIIVLIGALVIRWTNFYLIDPLMSIGVSLFILIGAVKNLKEIIDLFLEKTPRDIHLHELRAHLCMIKGVMDIHHLHVWSMDGHSHYATMHVVTNEKPQAIKDRIREELQEHGITHATLELETPTEDCHHHDCHVVHSPIHHHHHH